jgi:hypothetical protein
MVQGKDRKAKRFAGANCALRRGQRRPKLYLGETYAPIIKNSSCSPRDCLAGPFLLGFAVVASGQPIG